jgi:hypothetical protein
MNLTPKKGHFSTFEPATAISSGILAISELPEAKPTPSYGEENSIKCSLYPYTQKTRPKQQFLLRNTLFFLLKVLAFRGSRYSRLPLRA